MEMRIRESNGTFKVTVLSLAGQELSIYREISGGLTFELREIEEVNEVAAFKMEAMEALQEVVEEIALLDEGTLEVIEEVALLNEGTLEQVEEINALEFARVPIIKASEIGRVGTEETIAMVATQEESEEEAIKKEARNNAIFHKLSDLRRQLATAEKVPPFLVFHDKTLWGMVENMPSSLPALGKISGVGKAKLEKYGNIFLSALQECA